MKILHITDSHGTVKGPENRKDIYYISFLRKFYELGLVIKKMGIDMVVHTGDLFHTPRVSNKFAGQVSEFIKAMGVPFYVVPGNHDIEGYTTDTIDQTMLGLLAKTGVVTLLTRDTPVQFTAQHQGESFTVAISGQEYYAHIDEGSAKDFEMQQDPCDLNILAIHSYISDVAQHPDIKHTLCQDVVTDADIILTGHYHRQFEWCNPDVSIYNPGSMMRVDQTEYNRTHVPGYGILDISLNSAGEIEYEYAFHEFKSANPSEMIFDYQSKYQARHAAITLEGFKTSLANTMATIAPSTNIVKIIGDLCMQGNIDQQIEKLALQEYNNTLQNIPDEYEAQPGYIESPITRKIASVHLENFQSHADTTVDFTDGLNIIVGESNNGKTSILRAIMWVIDNQPLGTDFIMAGQKECKVRINYDDGTFIERNRTLKDTGEYLVRYRDDNGNLQDASYRGFTNAIPVEVANVHQMPKVSITKDIETHLNTLSQLDAPFLLTESPQNKAAAIGRITGTHVIDATVKEMAKTIRSNSILASNTKSEIDKEQKALAALPNYDLIHQALKAYERVISYAAALSQKIDTITPVWSELAEIKAEIESNREKLTRHRAVLSLQPIIESTLLKVQNVICLSNGVAEIETHKASIVLLKEEITRAKHIAVLQPLVAKGANIHASIQTLQGLLKTKDDLSKSQEAYLQTLRRNQEKAEVLQKATYYIESLLNQVNAMESYVHECLALEQSIDEAKKAKRGFARQLTIFKKQIAKTSQEKLEFIVQHGLCPCCGQPIQTQEVASNVNNFMEGMNNE